MLPVRSRLYGNKSQNCPQPIEPVPCYEPCEHTAYVLSKSLPLIGNPFYLESLLRGQLKVAESFLAKLCNPLEICKEGETLGFPCVQCGFVAIPSFSLCACEYFECNNVVYEIINPCVSIEAPICQKKCLTTSVDFSTAEDSFDLYTKIINAIKSFQGSANWSGLNDFVKLVYGEDAKVVTFINGVYYLNIGREMSEFETNTINIIKRVFPVPIGAEIKFVRLVS